MISAIFLNINHHDMEFKMGWMFFATGLLLLLSVHTVHAQQPDNIIVGTVYNIFHEEYPTDEDFFRQVDKDIALMKASHISHVLIFPMNQWDPETKQLFWKRTDYLIQKIEEAKLKFVPLMLKQEQCSHYFPIWKFKEIEGMWEKHNQKNNNKNNRENVDFADPNIYPLVEEYFKAVIGRYGKSPALSFYNIWNEPHYRSDADHVIERYRKWLRNKYGTLQKLRIAWGKEYSDWDQISPFLNDNWNSSMPQIDWTMFRNELNGVLCGELVHTLRKYDTTHPVNVNPVSTPWAEFSNFENYANDNWVFTEYVDFNGISYYPDGWERGHDPESYPFWLHNLAFSTVRSASGNKNYILTEIYTNAQNGLALHGYLNKESVALLAWTALANDCKGMIYWKWEPFMRGRQSLGRGLCNVAGELAPRGEAVKELGSVVEQYGKVLFEAHLKKPQAAVLMDMVGLLKTLEQSAEAATNKFMYESNAGLFKALFEKNITVDILRADRGITLDSLKQYKIIYLPFQIVMRKKTADLLKEYVRQGGWVVADARTATINELDFAYRKSPGAGLDELFGAVRNDWVGKNSYFQVTMDKRNGNEEYSFEGKYFKDFIRPTGNVEVLGTFTGTDEPAIILNKYGKGSAILSAVPLGASYFEKPENSVNRLLIALARQAGVVPDAEFQSDTNSFLDLKVHKGNKTFLVYIINSEGRNKSGTINVRNIDCRIKSIRDIISNNTFTFQAADNSISIPIHIEGNSVMVLLLEE